VVNVAVEAIISSGALMDAIISGALDWGMKKNPTKKRLAISAPMPRPMLRYFISDDRIRLFYRRTRSK
jgi:hypothetical protein